MIYIDTLAVLAKLKSIILVVLRSTFNYLKYRHLLNNILRSFDPSMNL